METKRVKMKEIRKKGQIQHGPDFEQEIE